MKTILFASTAMLLFLILGACVDDGLEPTRPAPGGLPSQQGPTAKPAPEATQPGLGATIAGPIIPGKPGQSQTPPQQEENKKGDITTTKDETLEAVTAFTTPVQVAPLKFNWANMFTSAESGATPETPPCKLDDLNCWQAKAEAACKPTPDQKDLDVDYCKGTMIKTWCTAWFPKEADTCLSNNATETQVAAITKSTTTSDTSTATSSGKLSPETESGWASQPNNNAFTPYFDKSVEPLNNIASYGGEGGGPWGGIESPVCGTKNSSIMHFITGVSATGGGFDKGTYFLDNLRFHCRRAGQPLGAAQVHWGSWIKQPAPDLNSVAFKGSKIFPDLLDNIHYILTGFYAGVDLYKNSTVLTHVYFVFRPLKENGIDYQAKAKIVATVPPGAPGDFISVDTEHSGMFGSYQPVLCPNGAAVKNLFGKAGEAIDSLGITCHKVSVIKFNPQ